MGNIKQLSTIENRSFKALIAIRELIAETMLIEGTDREEKQLKRMFINLTKIKDILKKKEEQNVNELQDNHNTHQ